MMKAGALALLCAVALLMPFSAAAPPGIPQGDYIVRIYAQDLSTSEYLADAPVQVYSRQANSQPYTVVSAKTRPDGQFTIYLDKGGWRIVADMDDPATPGKDLVAANDMNVTGDSNLTMVFQEVGSISGDVRDEENRTIDSADIHLDCVNSAYSPDELNDNPKVSKGAFFIKYVPSGACRVTFSAGDVSKTFDINLRKGEHGQLNVVLKREPFLPEPYLFALAAIALLLFASAIYYVARRPEAKAPPEQPAQPWPPPAEEKPEGLEPHAAPAPPPSVQPLSKTKKVLDVMKTLSPREREIVELLLENEGRMKQSRICARLLVPKTTLSRTVRSLEARNIVALKPTGKTNMIELTDWFKS